MRQIIIDTETTGLYVNKGDRILEIAGVELVDRRLTGNFYHQYIRPEPHCDINVAAFKVHGISHAFLADKPIFSTIASELSNFLGSAELIIHNAPFDIGFLDSEFKRLNATFETTKMHDVIDTLVLARKKHPGQQNSLDALCKRYNIDNSDRGLHSALKDAKLLAFVYLAMTMKDGQTTLFGNTVDHLIPKNSLMAEGVMSENKLKNHTIPLKFKIIVANEQELMAHKQKIIEIRKDSNGFLVNGFDTDD